MKIRYVAGNLLDTSTPVVHAVCGKLTMKVGTSKLLAEKYPSLVELIRDTGDTYPKAVGECYAVRCADGNIVYTLIDKATVKDSPTLDDIRNCFLNLKMCLSEDDVSKVSMARIGCGRDKLDWEDVKQILIDVFSDTDITFYIYQYVDEEDDVRNNNYLEAIREHAIILSDYDDVLIEPTGSMEIPKKIFNYGSVGDVVTVYCEDDNRFYDYRITCEKLYTYTFNPIED